MTYGILILTAYALGAISTAVTLRLQKDNG
jgi:hypothetical protein